MLQNDSAQAQENQHFTTKKLRDSQRRFGELLSELCEVSGFTQGKLSREAKEECRRLLEKGVIHPDDSIGSMEQPTVSKVMAGVQAPTYLQAYIWLRVLRAHFESQQFGEICRKLKINPQPKFTPALEKQLWYLLNFVPPEDPELSKVYKETKNLKLLEIHRPLIEHKEERWDRARRRSVGKSAERSKGTKRGTKFLQKTSSPRDAAAASPPR